MSSPCFASSPTSTWTAASCSPSFSPGSFLSQALLRRDELDDVAKRIAHYASLRLLSREETTDYLNHRFTIAGAKTVPFDANAIDAIFEIGRGNLRATDRLALKTLEVAHNKDTATCDQNLVAQARKMLWP